MIITEIAAITTAAIAILLPFGRKLTRVLRRMASSFAKANNVSEGDAVAAPCHDPVFNRLYEKLREAQSRAVVA